MLNRITGYFIFVQASYFALFCVLALIDVATHHSVFSAIGSLRSAMAHGDTYVRHTDYLYYPFAFSTPLNVFLLVAFLCRALRNSKELSLPSDFFSILNAFYVVGGGWVMGIVMFLPYFKD